MYYVGARAYCWLEGTALHKTQPIADRGTIIGQENSDHYRICLDNLPGQNLSPEEAYITVPKGYLSLMSQEQQQIVTCWSQVPGFLGAYVTEDTCIYHGSGVIPAGSTGRILSYQNVTGILRVALDKSIDASLEEICVNNTIYPQVSSILVNPSLHLAHLKPAPAVNTNRQVWWSAPFGTKLSQTSPAENILPGQTSGLQPGELVTYIGKEGIAVFNPRTGIRKKTRMQAGAILEIRQILGTSHPLLQAEIVDNAPDSLLGGAVHLGLSEVTRFPHTHLLPGSRVQVVADIFIRKENLRGKKGRVLLGLDFDGDVGVELDEDVQTGNLDGAGRDGHCIYLPEKALQRIPNPD